MLAKDVVSTLAEQGITVTEGLVYFVKGKMKGKRAGKKKAPFRATAMRSRRSGRMVKGWASQVGGMKKLRELVEALSV